MSDTVDIWRLNSGMIGSCRYKRRCQLCRSFPLYLWTRFLNLGPKHRYDYARFLCILNDVHYTPVSCELCWMRREEIAIASALGEKKAACCRITAFLLAQRSVEATVYWFISLKVLVAHSCCWCCGEGGEVARQSRFMMKMRRILISLRDQSWRMVQC